jgi:glycosyltransferase involved in cell wall biosynthesis
VTNVPPAIPATGRATASAQELSGSPAPEITVVIPCLDEAETIGRCIDKARASLVELGVDAEILVADNGSSDGSLEIAVARRARVVPVADRGYGHALAAGIAAARGRYVIMGDADDSYDFSGLEPFVCGLREGHDLVVGNRFQGGIRPGAMPFLHKHLGNPLLSFIGRRVFGTPSGDIYCGLRGFDRERIQALDIRSGGMEFAIEMIVKATMAGYRIAEVPTTLAPDGRDRAPHLRTWRDGWRSLRLLMLYSPAWLFLYPGLGLLAIGIGGMAWLVPAQRRVGDVTFDVSTLVYAALAVIIGFQAVLFFVSARLFGVTEGLLPPSPGLSRLMRRLSLELGLLGAVILIAIGLGASVYAIASWNAHHFGHLSYPHTLRLVIPGSTLIACGFQLMFSSLLVGALGLKRR